MKVRLYLDEDVLPDLAEILRSRGIDTVSVHEVGALELADEQQLERAAQDGRALLTFNYIDFLRIARDWLDADRTHAGIVVSYRQYRRREIGAIAEAIEALATALTAENLHNSVQVLDAFRPN